MIFVFHIPVNSYLSFSDAVRVCFHTIACTHGCTYMLDFVFAIKLQVDNDGLHDLNVQANWQQKGGTYWVRFCHCELLGDIDTAGVMAFKPGDKIRVKRAVTTPK